MTQFRNILIGFAQVIMVVIICGSTLGAFIVCGEAAGLGQGFNGFAALMGGLLGLLVSCAAMSLLAILLDIRQTLLRIETKPV